MNAVSHRVIVKSPEGGLDERVFTTDVITIGKADSCDIVIKGWAIGKQHAEIRFAGHEAIVHSQNALVGVGVNGVHVKEYGPLKPKDEIQLGGYSLFVFAGRGETSPRNGVAKAASAPPVPIHSASAANAPPTPPAPIAAPAPPQAVASPISVVAAPAPTTEENAPQAVDVYMEWRKKVHAELIKMMDVRRTDITTMSEGELELSVQMMLDVVLSGMDLPAEIDAAILNEQVLHEAIGLGPLEPLINDEEVTEIMVNAHNEIYVERNGKLLRTQTSFTSDRAVLAAIDRIVAPIGRKIDESSPLVDARLKDGSRVNAVIPPLALKGPSITIRKFGNRRLYGEDLVRFGSLDTAMLEFLAFCVRQAKNIVISGGTGSGKTTLLNVLSNFIPDDERIVTVEDAAELRLSQPNLVSLEARPPNSEGKGAVTIRELVKNCLRMRPDRIVVGECRGGEALDMLQAMNTGHDGSLTTAHANSPRDMLSRLETMVLMAGMDLPISAVREQIASAIHLIVQQTRFKCGNRKITAITEVTGVESGRIQLQDIFVFVRDGYTTDGKIRGHYTATGAVPEFLEEMIEAGVQTPSLDIFKAQNDV
jgi:pilus assembly protein CpaF